MTEPITESLVQAQKLWKLARFAEAEVSFLKALNGQDDLLPSVELAAMYLDQGCFKKCLEELNKSLDRFEESHHQSGLIGAGRMLQALTTASVELTFSGPLKQAVELYNDHLAGLPAEQYDKHQVSERSCFPHI
jgi:tetratricopeptide (TPR) repeat protein